MIKTLGMAFASFLSLSEVGEARVVLAHTLTRSRYEAFCSKKWGAKVRLGMAMMTQQYTADLVAGFGCGEADVVKS